MAKRRYGRPMKKMQPAVMQMEFLVPTGVSYIDLSLAASIANRRAYKQQDVTWAVGQFELLGSSTSSGTFTIGKLPETWVYKNAYTKAKNLWYKMNKQVLDENPDIQGKYQDFKIYMNSDMASQTIQQSRGLGGAGSTSRILTPYVNSDWTQADFTGTTNPKSDWNYSTIQVPNDPTTGTTTEYTLHAIGPGAGNSEGIIEGYALSRSRPQLQDPNTPGAASADDWMSALFDDGDQLEDLKSDLIADNDMPPYPVGSPGGNSNYYPGGANELDGLQVHSFCQFTPTTVSSKNIIMGGSFQQGLMTLNNDTGESVSMLVHMVPGHHRGYLCEVDA